MGFRGHAASLTATMTGQILLAWLKLLALDGDLARAGPRTLRTGCCTPPTASCAAADGACEIQATRPCAEAITTAWQRINVPHAPGPAKPSP